ncbi:MAG: molybdopterin-dependent oxidoreductase, partial [Peptococcaceae bacterium]|nr:molybdopterin-dependent oxidoreductase [Peptococcaceae bacterium]
MEFKSDLGKPWKYEEDGYTVVRTSIWSPPGCHPVGCGLKLYVNKDGILEKIEGDENDPVTKGRLCVRCLALKEIVYNPKRIIYPMKRDPKYRGQADKWERITWDEAYEIIKQRREEIVEKYGVESIVVFCGTGRNGGIMGQEFAQDVLGTPNACYAQSGFACYTPRAAATAAITGCYYPEVDYAGGLDNTYDNPEFKVPEVIVLWGKEPLPSNGDGFFGHAIIDLMKRGTKLISIDPRVNWLSTRADIHLRVRPGTDTAMGMAWLNIIINEGLYDHEFVENWCYGFEELKERVATMPPEKAAEICEVDVERIYDAARMYAKAAQAGIAWGLAVDQNQNGSQLAHCILALIAITGNLDVPGGQIVGEAKAAEVETDGITSKWEATGTLMDGWNALGEELRDKCIGRQKYPLYVNSIRMAHADMMLDTILTGDPYEIKMGMIQSSNVIAPTCSAESDKWHKALKKLDFVFATDIFMTPTIEACADLFLPLKCAPEHDSVNYTHYAASQVHFGITNKAIEVGECKSDVEIAVELGRYLGRELYFKKWPDEKTWLNTRRLQRNLIGGGKEDFDTVREKVHIPQGHKYRKYLTGELRPDRQPGFLTSTGRVELYSYMFESVGADPLPYYQEPAFSPHSTPELAKEYPFILTTGARVYAFFHSEHRQSPLLRELNPNPLIEINPEDARELGISDGQWVEISNQFGSAKLKAKITPIVRKGTVMAQHGWWFPEQDGNEPNLYGIWQSNINTLVPNHYNGSLGFGAPYKCMICKVTPLKE